MESSQRKAPILVVCVCYVVGYVDCVHHHKLVGVESDATGSYVSEKWREIVVTATAKSRRSQPDRLRNEAP